MWKLLRFTNGTIGHNKTLENKKVSGRNIIIAGDNVELTGAEQLYRASLN